MTYIELVNPARCAMLGGSKHMENHMYTIKKAGDYWYIYAGGRKDKRFFPFDDYRTALLYLDRLMFESHW